MSNSDKLYRAVVRFDAVLKDARRRFGSILIPKVILLHHRHTPNRCFYCGVIFGDGETAQSYDHIHPRSQGGRRTAENIVPACIRCNQLKRSKRHGQFRQMFPDLFPDQLFWAEVTHGCKITERVEYPISPRTF
jgi:5-methylcytosine-specific restriction endonuclease McrA